MANLNKILLAGRLTRDPELAYTPAQTAVCSFCIAVNKIWYNRDGEKQEEVNYLDCVTFGKRAETINKYLHKGSPLFVEGYLRLEKWETQAGEKRSKQKVVVESFGFLGSKGDNGGRADNTENEMNENQAKPPKHDDIPF